MAKSTDPRWTSYRNSRSIEEPPFKERFGWRYTDYKNHVYGDTVDAMVLDLAEAVIALEKRVGELEAQID